MRYVSFAEFAQVFLRQVKPAGFFKKNLCMQLECESLKVEFFPKVSEIESFLG